MLQLSKLITYAVVKFVHKFTNKKFFATLSILYRRYENSFALYQKFD